MLAGVVTTGWEALTAAETELAIAGVESPHVDAEWLLAGILGVGRAELDRVLVDVLPEPVVRAYRAAIQRRAAGEPLQQILGWEGFRGLRLSVTPDVLIPRPETEVLVDIALRLLASPQRGVRPRVVDLGTGSGCIACTIAHERSDANVLALDCSDAAARLARDNVEGLGFADRVGLVVADMLSAVASGCADLIVANPPYLSSAMLAAAPREVREHEPHLALAGGEDGLGVLRRIVDEAPRALRRGGGLVLETAGGDQADAVATLLRTSGWTDVVVTNDLAGIDRFVSGRFAGDEA